VGPRIDDPDAPHLTWIRPRMPFPDAAPSRLAAIAFASGFYTHWAFERRLGPRFDVPRHRPLDHALWIHAAPAWDDWWLVEATCSVAAQGIGLAHRRLYARDGHLLATASHAAFVATKE
jgi:acyl-CoA thioesterase